MELSVNGRKEKRGSHQVLLAAQRDHYNIIDPKRVMLVLAGMLATICGHLKRKVSPVENLYLWPSVIAPKETEEGGEGGWW